MTTAVDQSPLVDFTANTTTGRAPLTVRFNGTSTGFPLRWSWDFGDGSTSSLEDPLHTYVNPGNYTVTLHVVYTTGSASKVKPGYVTVTGALDPPAARFTANPVSGTAPLTVRFSDQSTGSPVFWFWDFGDGSSSNLENPIHVYRSPGIYTARLIVGNSAGNTIATRVILVDPPLTTA
jgi:PKD repeat protein